MNWGWINIILNFLFKNKDKIEPIIDDFIEPVTPSNPITFQDNIHIKEQIDSATSYKIKK
jgi:hypothetical protein